MLEKEKIEELYNISIKKIKEIKRWQKTRIPCYKIIAKEGQFFLKTYDEDIDLRLIKSFEILEFLVSKGYPAIKPFRSKRGNWIEIINNVPVALFEFIDGEK